MHRSPVVGKHVAAAVLMVLALVASPGTLHGATTAAPPTFPVRSPGKWAVVLCQLSGRTAMGHWYVNPHKPANLKQYQDFFGTSTAFGGGVAQWFHDVSRGRATMAGSTVFDWKVTGKTSNDLTGLSRSAKVVACAQASDPTRDYTKYAGIYAIFNGAVTRWDTSTPPQRVGDTGVGAVATVINGKKGKWKTVVDGNTGTGVPSTYFAAHEILHSLGFGHSFNTDNTSCQDWGLAGEYCDPWDIMSDTTGTSALTLEQAGWLAAGQEVNAKGGGRWVIDPINPPVSRSTCGPIGCTWFSRPTKPIAIYIPIPGRKDARSHLTVELQVPGGWQSLNQSVVVVHEARIEAKQTGETNPQLLPDGARSRLLNNAILQPGPSRQFTVRHHAHDTVYRTHSSICRSGVRVTVNAIDHQRADVSVEFVHCPLILAPPPTTTTIPETTVVPTTNDTRGASN